MLALCWRSRMSTKALAGLSHSFTPWKELQTIVSWGRALSRLQSQQSLDYKNLDSKLLGWRSHSSDAQARKGLLHFCVVGSGPAGFYTVSQLLKTFKDRARVSILERLPTPFGLVRSGVAPDHPETKNVINQFTELGKDPRVSFFGNVNAGHDIPLSTLRSLFHGVILAYGAESNRVLNIPGRHSEGIFTAREFVWWYNGHPEYAGLPINLEKPVGANNMGKMPLPFQSEYISVDTESHTLSSPQCCHGPFHETKRVVVLGLGNVALDCARVLLQPPSRLRSTDITQHAMSQLNQSNVEEVTLIGRRGPAQAAFTAKELREVLRIDGIHVAIDPQDMVLTDHDRAELKQSRARKRVYDLLLEASKADTSRSTAARQLRLQFFRSPVSAVANSTGQLEALTVDKTKLVQMDGKQTAVSSGQTEEIKSELMLESIGYRSIAMPGAPFDERRGCIPNRDGRVVDGTQVDAETLPGLYVSGWVKRGPSGIIGTNLVDATETVNKIAEDEYHGILGPGFADDPSTSLYTELQKKEVQIVTFKDWTDILDEHETREGSMIGKPRLKMVDVAKMLELCHSQDATKVSQQT